MSPAALARVRELARAGPADLHGWMMGRLAVHIAACSRRPVGWADVATQHHVGPAVGGGLGAVPGIHHGLLRNRLGRPTSRLFTSTRAREVSSAETAHRDANGAVTGVQQALPASARSLRVPVRHLHGTLPPPHGDTM